MSQEESHVQVAGSYSSGSSWGPAVSTHVQVTFTGRKERVEKLEEEGENRMGCLSSKEKYR